MHVAEVKVSVATRVLVDGSKVVLDVGKIHTTATSVQQVVDAVLWLRQLPVLAAI